MSSKSLSASTGYDFIVEYSTNNVSCLNFTVPVTTNSQTLTGWSTTVSQNLQDDSQFSTGDFSISLQEALDATNLTWTTSGDALWFGQANVSFDGISSAQSGTLADEQMSVLQTTVTGPGTLSFFWQTAGEADEFDLEFDDNGNYADDITSQTSWSQFSYNVPAGTHTLTWTAYSGDGSSPDDFGYVDQVQYIPVTIPPPPSPGEWTLTGSLANPTSGQTATLLPNGKVLVAGGVDTNNNPVSYSMLYDPATGTWTGTLPLNQARFNHTATLLTNGLVLVVGGMTNRYDASTAIGTAELYDPTNGTWTMTGSLNTPRYAHTATLLANGEVLVAGGQSTNAFPNITASAETFDPGTGLWTPINPMLLQRNSHTATLLPDGQVLVAGGEVTNRFLVTSESELFDPTSGTWAQTGYMPNPLAFHSATLLPDGQVLVAGGDFEEGFGPTIDLVSSSFAQLYDPGTGMWTATTSMNYVHDHHTATLLTNGVVLIAGGGTQFGTTTNCELYEPVSQTWTVAASLIKARQTHTATLLPNGEVLATGGQYFGNPLASAELYSSIIRLPIFLIDPIKSANGAFQFSWTNTAGSSNVVLAATNLSTPLSNWMSLTPVVETPPGQFQFTDLQATNQQRFYRVRSP